MRLAAEAVAATVPALSARYDATDGGPQVWYTAWAGHKKSTQLAKVRRRGTAGAGPEQDGRLPGEPGLFFAEWSIRGHTDHCDPGCDLHAELYDEASYRQANPAYGIRINAAAVENERRLMSNDETFGRERLGIGTYPAAADDWAVIPETWWADTMTARIHAAPLIAPPLAAHPTPTPAITPT